METSTCTPDIFSGTPEIQGRTEESLRCTPKTIDLRREFRPVHQSFADVERNFLDANLKYSDVYRVSPYLRLKLRIYRRIFHTYAGISLGVRNNLADVELFAKNEVF